MSTALKNFLVSRNRPGYGSGFSTKTAGMLFTESEAYKKFLSSGQNQSDNVPISTKALLTSTASNGLMRANSVFGQGQQALTMRDLLAPTSTGNNAVEYVRETGYTNAAAPVAEGALKPESTLTFQNVTALVKTIAHFLPVTRQVIADIPGMQAHIDQRLLYGLAKVEENQLLNGTGTGENLEGLMVVPGTQAYTAPAGESQADSLRKAITMTLLAGYPATGAVLHPSDFEDLELLKATDGSYLLGTAADGAEAKLWRLPIVQSTSMTPGTFLTGAFGTGAQLFDREDANIKISDSHADFFTRNQLAVLCEERVAFAIYRPESFVRGTFATA